MEGKCLPGRSVHKQHASAQFAKNTAQADGQCTHTGSTHWGENPNMNFSSLRRRGRSWTGHLDRFIERLRDSTTGKWLVRHIVQLQVREQGGNILVGSHFPEGLFILTC